MPPRNCFWHSYYRIKQKETLQAGSTNDQLKNKVYNTSEEKPMKVKISEPDINKEQLFINENLTDPFKCNDKFNLLKTENPSIKYLSNLIDFLKRILKN